MDHDFGTSPISSEQRQKIISQQQINNNNTNKNDHKEEQDQSDRVRPIRSIIIDEDESGDEGIKDESAANISNQHEQIIIISPDTDHNYMLGVDHPKGPNPVFPVIGGLEIVEKDEYTHTKGHLIQKPMKRLPSNYNTIDGNANHNSYYQMKIGTEGLSTKSISTQQQSRNSPFTQRQAIYKGLLPTLRPASQARPPATNLDNPYIPGVMASRDIHHSLPPPISHRQRPINIGQDSAYDYEGPAPMITTTRGRVPGMKSRNVMRDSIEQPELEDDGVTFKYSLPPSNMAQLSTQLMRKPEQRRQNTRSYQTNREQRERENEQQRQFEEQQQKKYLEEEEKLNADFWEKGNLPTASKKRQRSPRKTTAPSDPNHLLADQDTLKPPDDPFLTPQQMPSARSRESPRHSTFDTSTIDGTINAVVRGEASVMQQHFGPPPIITTTTSHHLYQTHQQQPSTPYKLQLNQVPRKFDSSPQTQISHQRLDELAELANASANLLEQTTSSMGRNISFQQQHLFNTYQSPQPTLHFKVVQTSHQDELFPNDDYKQQKQIFTVQQQQQPTANDEYAQHISARRNEQEQQMVTKKQPTRSTKKGTGDDESEQQHSMRNTYDSSVDYKHQAESKTVKRRRSMKQEMPSKAMMRASELVEETPENTRPKRATRKSKSDYTTRCICGLTHNDPFMIQCDKCDVWQHAVCMGISAKNIPDEYLCEECYPRPLKNSSKRAYDIQQHTLALQSEKQKPNINLKRKSTSAILKIDDGIHQKKFAKLNANDGQLRFTKSFSIGDGKSSGEITDFIEITRNQYSRTVRTMMNQMRPYVLGEIGLLRRLEKTPMTRQMLVTPEQMGLVATQGKITIAPGIPIVEYTGKFSLLDEMHSVTPNNPINHEFTLIYSGLENDIFVDATNKGSIARFARRSCQPNAKIQHAIIDGKLRLYLYASTNIENSTEITIPFDYDYRKSTTLVACACGVQNFYANTQKGCPIAEFNKSFSSQLGTSQIVSKHQSPPKLLVQTTSKMTRQSIFEVKNEIESPSKETPKKGNEVEDTSTGEEGRRLRIRNPPKTELEQIKTPQHGRITRKSTLIDLAKIKEENVTEIDATVGAISEIGIKAQAETKVREHKMKPGSSSYDDFLDPPVSSNSKPIQNKPGTDSALTPQQNPSISSSPIPRKRGRPAGPGAGVIPIEYQQKKPEIQTTDSEKLTREERKMQAMIASIERAEQIKESKMHKNSEEQLKKVKITPNKSQPTSTSLVNTSKKDTVEMETRETDMNSLDIWSKLCDVLKEKVQEQEEFQLPNDYNKLRKELFKKSRQVDAARSDEKPVKNEAKVPISSKTQKTTKIYPSSKQDAEIMMASSQQAKEAALPITQASKSTPSVQQSRQSFSATMKSRSAETSRKEQKMVEVFSDQHEILAAPDNSRQPNTKAHKKITIEEYKRKKKAEMEAKQATGEAGTSGTSTQASLSQSPIRQSPRKSFIPTVSSTSSIIPSPPQQLEEFLPSPSAVSTRPPAPTLNELRKKILSGENTGRVGNTSNRSEQEQSEHQPPVDLPPPPPPTRGGQGQQPTSLEERLKIFVNKRGT